MMHAAAHTNRVRALLALSNEVPAETFIRLAGQHPDTLPRDLESANRDFSQAKCAYEDYCKTANVPAYAFYTED